MHFLLEMQWLKNRLLNAYVSIVYFNLTFTNGSWFFYFMLWLFHVIVFFFFCFFSSGSRILGDLATSVRILISKVDAAAAVCRVNAFHSQRFACTRWCGKLCQSLNFSVTSKTNSLEFAWIILWWKTVWLSCSLARLLSPSLSFDDDLCVYTLKCVTCDCFFFVCVNVQVRFVVCVMYLCLCIHCIFSPSDLALHLASFIRRMNKKSREREKVDDWRTNVHHTGDKEGKKCVWKQEWGGQMQWRLVWGWFLEKRSVRNSGFVVH